MHRTKKGHAHVPRGELVYAGVGFHLAAVAGLIVLPAPGMTELMLFGASYTTRMFGVVAGHHRYFSHRAFSTSRWFQCTLATLGAMGFQRGPIWWASHHTEHHLHSDTKKDSHSPVSGSLVWAHVGWFWATEENDKLPDKLVQGKMKNIERWQKFPELVWLDKNDKIPPILLGFACYLLGDFSGLIGSALLPTTLIWGFVLPTVGIWHGMWSLNSICHTWGTRRFATADNSRNNWWMTLPLLGGNWHNNHHAFHWSAREGLKWWEIDPAYYALKGLEKLGIVWNLKVPSEQQIARLEAKHAKDPTVRIKNTLIPAVVPAGMYDGAKKQGGA